MLASACLRPFVGSETGGADAAESGPITDAGPAENLPTPLFMGGKLAPKGVARIGTV